MTQTDEYAARVAAGDELMRRVEAHALDVGIAVVVGRAEGRNCPRYTVVEKGRSKVPLVTWSPAWDGWEVKAERALRDAGLLPDGEETQMPAPNAEEIRRSDVLREQLRDVAAKAHGRSAVCRRAVELMAERGVEPFGGGTAATEPLKLAEIQLTKFFEGSALLDKNLTKWEGVLEALQEEFGERAAPPAAPAPAASNGSGDEALREQLAARDDDLVAARRRVEELEAGETEAVRVERQKREAAEQGLKDAEARWEEQRRDLEDRIAGLEASREENARASRELATVEDASPERVASEPDWEHGPGWPQARVIVAHEQPDGIASEVRRRYADQLLRQLDRAEPGTDLTDVMARLDRIAEIELQQQAA